VTVTSAPGCQVDAHVGARLACLRFAAEFRIALKLNPGSNVARDGLSQVLAKLPPGTP